MTLIKFEDLNDSHIGARFRIVKHRLSAIGGECAYPSPESPYEGELQPLHEFDDTKRHLSDPTSCTGRRFFGPGSVLELVLPLPAVELPEVK